MVVLSIHAVYRGIYHIEQAVSINHNQQTEPPNLTSFENYDPEHAPTAPPGPVSTHRAPHSGQPSISSAGFDGTISFPHA